MFSFLKKHVQKKKHTCSVVIVAAGSSSRMKGTDKILYPIGEQPLIAHTIRVFDQCESVTEIVVVTRDDLVELIEKICSEFGFQKVSAITVGGKNRAESVMKGLDHVKKNTAYVAVHDGARPFVTADIVEDTLAKAVKYHAAAPGIAVKDTIKVVKEHIIVQTPDRTALYAVQTPQIFDFDLLRGALTKAMKEDLPITDDCSAVEAIGMSVYLTEGSDENMKVTTPTDLILAQAIWEGRNVH